MVAGGGYPAALDGGAGKPPLSARKRPRDPPGARELTPRRIDELVADGTISGGMIPKIAGALDAAKSGVNAVHIIDGRVPHALLLEVLGNEPFGTMIRSH